MNVYVRNKIIAHVEAANKAAAVINEQLLGLYSWLKRHEGEKLYTMAGSLTKKCAADKPILPLGCYTTGSMWTNELWVAYRASVQIEGTSSHASCEQTKWLCNLDQEGRILPISPLVLTEKLKTDDDAAGIIAAIELAEEKVDAAKREVDGILNGLHQWADSRIELVYR